MKIGIDARMYGPRQSGLGRYVEQLIKNLEKIDTHNQYILFFRKDNWDEFTPANPNFKKVLADIPWYSLKEQLLLPTILNKEKLDLMHFPHWNMPLLYRRPFIVTIHDLIMYHYPRAEASTHGPLVYWLKDKAHRLILKSATRRALRIITPTKFSKNDLIKTINAPQEKITVTYLAPAPSAISAINSDSLKPKTLPETVKTPFALYVGNAYPHKNLTNLLLAWKIVKEKNINCQLVLVGRKNYFYDRLTDSPEFKNLKNVNYLGYQDDAILESLYQKASLYVFPSFYEGFGLPPLEAMQHNLPVVSSNSSCLREILQDAALYFDPNSPNDMATKIVQVINDQNLRENLKLKGQKLLKNYSFENTARQTLAIYENGG